MIWVARLLVITGLAWTAYRVVQRRLRGRYELPWLAGSGGRRGEILRLGYKALYVRFCRKRAFR